jgi:Fic family protein
MLSQKLSYKITDKTLVHISSVERNLSLLNQNEVIFRSKHRLASESLFDDLFSISQLLNLNLTLSDVKKISLGNNMLSSEAQLLVNIKQIFDYVRNNYKKDQIVFNFHFVQHIIKLLQTNILDVWDVGKIRTGEEVINKVFELENQHYESADITNLLADSIMWVETEENIHPIVKACEFMVFINTISPFSGLNFISSLIFFRMILDKYNYGSYFRIALFKIFQNKKLNVKELLNETLIEDSNTATTDIINKVSENLDELLQNYKSEFIQFDYFDVKSGSEKLDLNERQLEVLKLLQNKVSIKRREFIKLFKVSPMTAYRDLNYLLEKKLLVVSGEGKSTLYTLSTKVS